MSVYFILHIPKTAGITIAEHLADNCAPGAFWRPPPPRLFDDLGALPDFDRVRAVAPGHYRGRSLEGYFPGREIRRVVLLRDPVGLHLSYYNWRMMRFLSLGRGTYGFPLHLRTLPRNLMMHCLLRYWLEIPSARLLTMSDRAKFDLVQRHLSQFWFVGAHTDCAGLIAALAPDLDIPAVAASRNTSGELLSVIDWQPLSRGDLSPEMLDAIVANNRLDQLLWETWHRAGFDAARVRPAEAPRNSQAGALRHGLARPVLEVVRLWQRGPARRPDIAEIGLPPRADTDANVTRMTAEGLLDRLQREPENAGLWRAYLTICRRKPPRNGLPASLIGSPEATHDPGLCLLKAEVLACCGQDQAAQRFFRYAPALASTRRQARDMTVRAGALDAEFVALVRRADAARDRHDWHKAASLYRDALDLHPGHWGYMVQYAHCLNFLQDYAAAEIYYRSARALGAPLQDVQEQLRAVAAKQGYNEPTEGGAAWRPSVAGATLLDDPPTRADVAFAAYIVTGAALDDAEHILRILRSTLTIRGVLHAMIVERNPTADDARLAALVAAAGDRFIETRRMRAAGHTSSVDSRPDAPNRAGADEPRLAPALTLV